MANENGLLVYAVSGVIFAVSVPGERKYHRRNGFGKSSSWIPYEGAVQALQKDLRDSSFSPRPEHTPIFQVCPEKIVGDSGWYMVEEVLCGLRTCPKDFDELPEFIWWALKSLGA